MKFEGLSNLIEKRINAKTYALFLNGEVIKLNPLTVLIENRFAVDSDVLIQLEGFEAKMGDKLVLLQNHGGQSYLILGRVKG